MNTDAEKKLNKILTNVWVVVIEKPVKMEVEDEQKY